MQVVVSKGLQGGRKGKCKARDSIKVFSPFLQNSGVGPRVVGQSYLGEPMFICELYFLHKFIGIFIRAWNTRHLYKVHTVLTLCFKVHVTIDMRNRDQFLV